MNIDGITNSDRVATRQRPDVPPIMRQQWGKLLFIHWRIDARLLRSLIPSQLEIDTFEGSAWIGVIPFTMWGIRASFLPPIPGTSAFHELNVRTYVTYDGVPGVWFFSLDAANKLAVWGARKFYSLPYFNARISLQQVGNSITYLSTRRDSRGAPASFEATWTIGDRLPQSQPGSRDFFLTERYCLYSEHRGEVYRARIHHNPWPLQKAQLAWLDSSMIASHGLPTPEVDPQVRYCEHLSVDIWPLKKTEARA
ncbi:MAG: DUF2071 domain-containing protein [Pyrinomonadaceae bacterium]|nr:DUF2071 domain-containing protein [Pyrinomonadaceae bacterium]